MQIGARRKANIATLDATSKVEVVYKCFLFDAAKRFVNFYDEILGSARPK